MAVNCSTGFRSRILGPSSFESIFNYGCIEIRTGPQPASADEAATGSLIGRITADGGAWVAGNTANGLRFVRNAHVARNDPSQNWILSGLDEGTPGWFRLVGNAADDGGFSVSLPRVDGAIGLAEATGEFQMRLPVSLITPSTTVVISSWWFLLPPL